MPLFLLPPPRRLRITRRNFTLTAPVALSVDPRVDGPSAEAVAALAARFPLSPVETDVPTAIQVVPRGDAPGLSPLPELPDPGGSEERLALEVNEEGVILAATGPPGFRYGA